MTTLYDLSMEWIWLASIGLIGGIIALVVVATIAAFVARPRD